MSQPLRLGVGRSVLALSLSCIACGAAPAPVSPEPAPAPAPAAPSLAIPAAAFGVYANDERYVLQLVRLDERVLLVSPEIALVVQAKPTSEGFSLSTPARPPTADEDGELRYPLPPQISLLAPSSGGTVWKLSAPEIGEFRLRHDPWATRLAGAFDDLELKAIDEPAVDLIDHLQRDLRLIREQPAAELQNISNSNDPEWLASRGGLQGYLAWNLRSTLSDLLPRAQPSEASRVQGHIDAAQRVAERHGVLWPREQDAFLLALAKRSWRTQQTIGFRDGALLRLETIDQQKVAGCDLALIMPDPTQNSRHPWAPFTPPAPGKLGAFLYLGFVVQSGPPGSCTTLRAGESTYPVRHGLYSFVVAADDRAKVVGVMFIAYMAASLFVADDTAIEQLEPLGQAVNDELSRPVE